MVAGAVPMIGADVQDAMVAVPLSGASWAGSAGRRSGARQEHRYAAVAKWPGAACAASGRSSGATDVPP